MKLPWTVEELLPHSGQMVLIDEVIDYNEESITVRCTPRNDGLFNHESRNSAGDSVPAWVGIEYMAQAIATYSGIHRKKAGQEIQLGFLLGTRQYHSNVTHFPVGQALEIHAERSVQDGNGLCVFRCVMTGQDTHLEASINVFLPQDADAFLKENT
ncbi:Predicted 3-hydroxymyristoyl/3-hydroxydecanoyl-(acyl carrier protein) dehydratase [gamma proteobacterium HdN1]|nr:Predicted 3-hydroxymyristoyl/3-hydroxydecanoyl-(acyl carrier protein) dehydratase [gamma proteobacterium HdN1]